MIDLSHISFRDYASKIVVLYFYFTVVHSRYSENVEAIQEYWEEEEQQITLRKHQWASISHIITIHVPTSPSCWLWCCYWWLCWSARVLEQMARRFQYQVYILTWKLLFIPLMRLFWIWSMVSVLIDATFIPWSEALLSFAVLSSSSPANRNKVKIQMQCSVPWNTMRIPWKRAKRSSSSSLTLWPQPHPMMNYRVLDCKKMTKLV